jgi:DNA-binding GntR family transcriptional regulator
MPRSPEKAAEPVERRRRGETGPSRAPEATSPATRTLVEHAAEWLRESILSGDLSPGERVRLDGIAQELGMSPIPIREALRMLASEGLVVPLAHRGYTVQPLTVDDLNDTYRLRLTLEPLAVRLAVPHMQEEDITHLVDELDHLEQAFRDSDWPKHRIHHRAFHFGIYRKCNSTWLLRFTEMLWINSERYQRMTTRISGELNERRKEHRRIAAACEERDAERASELMHAHLSMASDTIRTFLSANDHVLGGEADVAVLAPGENRAAAPDADAPALRPAKTSP